MYIQNSIEYTSNLSKYPLIIVVMNNGFHKLRYKVFIDFLKQNQGIKFIKIFNISLINYSFFVINKYNKLKLSALCFFSFKLFCKFKEDLFISDILYNNLFPLIFMCYGKIYSFYSNDLLSIKNLNKINYIYTFGKSKNIFLWIIYFPFILNRIFF